MSVVRAALVQTDWTGDKESMIVKHEEYAREAAAAAGKDSFVSRSSFTGLIFARFKTQSSILTPNQFPVPPPSDSKLWRVNSKWSWSFPCTKTQVQGSCTTLPLY